MVAVSLKKKNVRVGQPATVEIDSYPGREWSGRVQSISQATGAEFSVLPPQNASGNWVKITQRIPLRIAIEHSWWGWVDVSQDMMPRITRAQDSANVWYAVGYGGNGVAFSTWAGKRLAERVAGMDFGKQVFDLPIYSSPLPLPQVQFGATFESRLFAPFRRIGQRALYKWYWLRDEY